MAACMHCEKQWGTCGGDTGKGVLLCLACPCLYCRAEREETKI